MGFNEAQYYLISIKRSLATFSIHAIQVLSPSPDDRCIHLQFIMAMVVHRSAKAPTTKINMRHQHHQHDPKKGALGEHPRKYARRVGERINRDPVIHSWEMGEARMATKHIATRRMDIVLVRTSLTGVSSSTSRRPGC